MLLAGDIGGTKTSLAIVSREEGPHRPLAEATFVSNNYPSLHALAAEFLATTGHRVQGACFGVAGPVVAGRAKVTNVPWEIDESQLAEILNLRSVRLINDLEAIATAVPILEPPDLHTLNEGRPEAGGAIAVVAPGTGLGEGYLTWDEAQSRYRAYPSEGGHASFAPSNALEMGLLSYLRERHGHVSCERVCSGLGLHNVYEYLRTSGSLDEPAWLAERLAAADDPNPIIVNAALDAERPCEICVATLGTFAAILGAEGGNMALKVLATGGVYLAGGIPRRIIPALQERFMPAFRDKGRFSRLLSAIPVHVIVNTRVALVGAACHGLSH
jgi:glucokinase